MNFMEHIMENPAEPLNLPYETPPETHHRAPARVGTVVWGAVVVLIATLIIVSSQLELSLDAAQTAMWLLLGAGVAMVAGGAVNLFRKK